MNSSPEKGGRQRCFRARNGTLKKIQSQSVARSASIPTLTIFRACGDLWNGIERPQNGTGKPVIGKVSEPGTCESRCASHDGQYDRRRRGSPRAGEVKPVPRGPGRRPDGYHEIESLMVTVDLYDTLTVTELDSGAIVLECDDPRLPTGSENLVVKAADVSRPPTGCARGAAHRPHEGDPRPGGAGGRIERRGGDPGGSRSDLGPGDARQPARRCGGRDRQRRGLLPARTLGGLSRAGRTRASHGTSGSPCTSCWSLPMSA